MAQRVPLSADKLPMCTQARIALRRLAAKLDALSHYSFAPRPVVEDMAIRADVPALAMEDVAPQVRRSRLSSSVVWSHWADSETCGSADSCKCACLRMSGTHASPLRGAVAWQPEALKLLLMLSLFQPRTGHRGSSFNWSQSLAL